jgi:3,4-dehydroadipyl-CoA semialdehyde dehydrogenase
VLGHELARVSSEGLDLEQGFAHAREAGGRALRALSYRERADLLGGVGKVLQAHREAYFEIAIANSGTTRKDCGMDIDGAIYTLDQYARWGRSLGQARVLLDGEGARLARDGAFACRHVLVPTRGVALFINAFNFPAWGLWEKAAPALLSGVPVIVKPATATAWIMQRMVADGLLPPGALSVVCGSSRGLLDALQLFDVLSFTGSAQTAALIRSHPAVAQRSVRVNIEADSLNSALLLPDAAPGTEAFELLVAEVVREMTVKSGQKCTAIRRVFVPQACFDTAAEAIGARLARITVGNPRNETVRMDSLVSREQLASVRDTEVFGPVATLMPYRSLHEALALVRRGEGSRVASLYGAEPRALTDAALALADSHGRVHVVSPEVAALNTGRGNVMPHSLHGGPGRTGGGEELGGLRALAFTTAGAPSRPHRPYWQTWPCRARHGRRTERALHRTPRPRRPPCPCPLPRRRPSTLLST